VPIRWALNLTLKKSVVFLPPFTTLNPDPLIQQRLDVLTRPRPRRRATTQKGTREPRSPSEYLFELLPRLRECLEMAVDRTAEFQAAVSSISSRSSKSPAESRRLLSTPYTNGVLPRATPKSEFSRMAAKIGHDINSTGAKLQKLAQRSHTPFRLLLIGITVLGTD
jgi:hypothetical protein